MLHREQLIKSDALIVLPEPDKEVIEPGHEPTWSLVGFIMLNRLHDERSHVLKINEWGDRSCVHRCSGSKREE